MLWVWFKQFLSYVGILLIPPPEDLKHPIDPNAECPACGNKDGELKYRVMASGNGFPGGPMVKHKCHVCRFPWYEKTYSIAKYPGAEED